MVKISAMDAPTPMLKQYNSVKEAHKDCILFFRLGDFYEMFFDDAKIVSRELDLVLTSRGKTPAGKIPMCGFPHHAANNYIAKLVKSGFKVAICEQTEDPALAKGIVKRDVTRIITSGTYLDENNHDPRYILALSPNSKNIGISFTDPTTGTLFTNEYPFTENRIVELISQLPVYECIFPQSLEENVKNIFSNPLLKNSNISLSPYEDWCFNPDIAKKSLCEHFTIHNLHGFGIEDLKWATSSTGALLEYLKTMNKQPLLHMDKISLFTNQDHMFISPAAHRGLELETLIRTLDRTITPLGKRNFKSWFYFPLKSKDAILKRQNAIALLKEDTSTQKDIKKIFSRIPDIEKNLSRISCGYTHAKDLLAIRNTLSLLPQLINITKGLSAKNSLFAFKDIESLRTSLEASINEDIPLSNPEGKVIKKGFNAELDSLKEIQENGREWLKKLQQEEIQKTGINSLKIGYNKVFGYYIEVTKTHSKSVPETYIRKQTLVNAERYITPELKDYEEKILTAQDKIIKIENSIISELQREVLKNSIALHKFCNSIATVDTIYSLSVLAGQHNYVLPEILENSLIEIKDGRHPVVEQTTADSFVPNDTLLDNEKNHLIILTGPNMSGKSTYIRQTAILVIMAQVGSFIPANSAKVGIVDKLFTRIGAHDDISKGQSTFMVEMNETADILNNLSENSLVILDEIGRGTSTFDGLSLAWALAEHIIGTKTRTLFATHFHELTALADNNEGVKNYNVAVKEWKDEIIFMHKIVPGGSDDSYGIYVAKLAGIPKSIISRAKKILTKLELQNDIKSDLQGKIKQDQLDMFSIGITQDDPKLEEIKSELDSMDIDNLKPIDALNKLQELKDRINE